MDTILVGVRAETAVVAANRPAIESADRRRRARCVGGHRRRDRRRRGRRLHRYRPAIGPRADHESRDDRAAGGQVRALLLLEVAGTEVRAGVGEALALRRGVAGAEALTEATAGDRDDLVGPLAVVGTALDDVRVSALNVFLAVAVRNAVSCARGYA